MILLITVASIIVGVRQAKQINSEGAVATGRKRAPIIFLLLILGYMVSAWVNAALINLTSDKIFPLTIASIGIVALLILLVQMMTADEGHALFADREAGGDDAEAAHGLWGTLAWFAGLLVLSSLFGFIIALAIFLLAFFRVRAGLSWQRTILLASAGIGFMCFIASTLNRDFPPGLLQEFVKLPWPFT
mgnify:CR=1 FL=1